MIGKSTRGKARRCASSAVSLGHDPSELEREVLRPAIPDRQFDIRIAKCTMNGDVLSIAVRRTAQGGELDPSARYDCRSRRGAGKAGPTARKMKMSEEAPLEYLGGGRASKSLVASVVSDQGRTLHD